MVATHTLSYQHTAGGATMFFPDIVVKQARACLLLGDSGKGKTTLLHLLAGLLRPTSGQIWIDNTNLVTLPESDLDKFRGRNIGIVFQQSHFISSLTVVENLLMSQFLAGISPNPAEAKSWLEKIGLADKLHRLTYQLSQGEQQRLAIVRALLHRPKVVLADEPTSALDDKNCETVIQLLETAALQAGATLLIVTHDKRLKDYFQDVIQL